MTLKGFFIHRWVGYLCGYLFLKRPWGHPSFKSWKTPYILWSFGVLVLQAVVITDMVLNVTGRALSVQSDSTENPVYDYLFKLIIGMVFGCFTFSRCVLVQKAKPLAKLLNQLSRYQFGAFKKIPACRAFWILLHCLGIGSLVLIVVDGVLFGMAYYGIPTKSMFESVKGLGAFLLAFMYITTASLRSFTFMLVACVTIQLGMIYQDLCDLVEDKMMMIAATVAFREQDLLSIAKVSKISKKRSVNSIEVLEIREGEKFEEFGHLGKVGKRMDISEIEMRLEELKDLAERAQCIMGPLILVTLIGAVSVVVARFFNTIVGNTELLVSLTGIMEQLVYLTLVFVGQKNKDLIRRRQKSLNRMLTLRPYLGRPGPELGIGDIGKLLMGFEWRLNACNVFDVDRQLLAGIMSTAMTYVVVLFQFQFALQPPQRK